jgi:hypothetical protein
MAILQCTDPVIGAILAGWRYDISGLSAAMRTDYDSHLSDVLLISATTLSFLAFLLAAIVLRRIEAIAHLGNSLHGHLYHTPIAISLEAVAIAGIVISLLLLFLVAIATPIPSLVSDALQQRIPHALRERIMKNAA